jgi:hypothetical protein
VLVLPLLAWEISMISVAAHGTQDVGDVFRFRFQFEGGWAKRSRNLTRTHSSQ